MRRNPWLAAAIVACSTSPAWCVTIASDSFIRDVPGGYVAGSLPGQNPTIPVGFSGAWQSGTTATGTFVVHSSNTSISTPNNMPTAGGQAAYNAGAPSGIRRVLRNLAAYTAPVPGTPTYWFSGLLQLDAVDTAGRVLGGFTSAGTITNDTDFFTDGTDFQIQGLLWGFQGDGTGTDLVMRYRNDNAGAGQTTTVQLVNQVTVGAGYALIAKLEKDFAGGSDRLSVWINPAATNTESALGAPTFVDSSTFILFQDTGISRLTLAEQDFGSVARFDEFRFGTTLFDVVPTPEPATATLGLIATLGLLGRRRRAS